MSETGGKVVDPFLRLDSQDPDDTLDVLNVLANLLDQPKPHVRRDLVVPAPSRVELSSNISTDNLTQPPLVGSVDVLVVLLDGEAAVAPFLLDLVETATDLGELVGGEDGRGGFGEGEGVGLGTGDVDGEEGLVEGEALVELPHAVRRRNNARKREGEGEKREEIEVSSVDSASEASRNIQRVGTLSETSSPKLLSLRRSKEKGRKGENSFQQLVEKEGDAPSVQPCCLAVGGGAGKSERRISSRFSTKIGLPSKESNVSRPSKAFPLFGAPPSHFSTLP
jgi:hypothetical protein